MPNEGSDLPHDAMEVERKSIVCAERVPHEHAEKLQLLLVAGPDGSGRDEEVVPIVAHVGALVRGGAQHRDLRTRAKVSFLLASRLGLGSGSAC